MIRNKKDFNLSAKSISIKYNPWYDDLDIELEKLLGKLSGIRSNLRTKLNEGN
ncbi:MULTISPECIES: hypothetical protein [Borreliella]|uniref:hypothetical protein n=1 Tax=Borreliella TaxID=64895 RepID=UPI002E18F4D3|nr:MULTISPECIES: hypothetical protein [Borreliella]